MNLFKNLTDKNIAAFYLLFMSVQFLFFEGFAVSNLKVAIMAISPFIWMARSPVITKALVWSTLFFVTLIMVLMVQFEVARSSTLYYTLLFLCCFNMYYGLIYYRNAFSIDDFIQVLKILIISYAVVLASQQILIIGGIRFFPLVNLMGQQYLAPFHSNSLAIEPSHAARVLTVAFYAFLRTLEVKHDGAPNLKELYQQHKWTIISFLFVMLGIGSGTAIVGLGILSLYFIRRQYIAIIIPAFFLLYMLIPVVDYEPLNRARITFNAAITGDTEEVVRVDNSAAARVNIIIDTFKYLDITDAETWFGKGIDSSATSKRSIVAGITDYGLLAHLLKVAFFVACCFTGILSIEMLIFILLFSMNIGNIAYGWACLMMLTTMKYFWINRKSFN